MHPVYHPPSTCSPRGHLCNFGQLYNLRTTSDFAGRQDPFVSLPRNVTGAGRAAARRAVGLHEPLTKVHPGLRACAPAFRKSSLTARPSVAVAPRPPTLAAGICTYLIVYIPRADPTIPGPSSCAAEYPPARHAICYDTRHARRNQLLRLRGPAVLATERHPDTQDGVGSYQSA